MELKYKVRPFGWMKGPSSSYGVLMTAEVLGLAPLAIGQAHHAVDVAATYTAFLAIAHEVEGVPIGTECTVRFPRLGVDVAAHEDRVAPHLTHQFAFVDVAVAAIIPINEQGLTICCYVDRGQVANSRVDVEHFRCLPFAFAVFVAHVNVLVGLAGDRVDHGRVGLSGRMRREV
jgi:hypothetical protein